MIPARKKFIETSALNEDLRQAANVNSRDDFMAIFKNAFEALVIDRMEGNEDIFARLMNDAEFRDLAQDCLEQKIYRTLVKNSENTEFLT